MSEDKGLAFLAARWEMDATKEEVQVCMLSTEPRARAQARIRTLRQCAKQLRTLLEQKIP